MVHIPCMKLLHLRSGVTFRCSFSYFNYCVVFRIVIHGTFYIGESRLSPSRSLFLILFCTLTLWCLWRVWLKWSEGDERCELLVHELKPATHVTETGTSRLVPEICTCVGQSGTRFFWYQILVRNRTQLYSITETVGHVTQTVQCDWPACCYCFCCH